MRVIIHKFTSVREREGKNIGERAQYIIYVNIRTNLRSMYIHLSLETWCLYLYMPI